MSRNFTELLTQMPGVPPLGGSSDYELSRLKAELQQEELEQNGEPLFKLLNHGSFSFMGNRAAFASQVLSLLLLATGKLRIKTAVILDDPPVRGNPLTTTDAIFLGRFRDDANKDAGRQRASHIGREIVSEPLADFADCD